MAESTQDTLKGRGRRLDDELAAQESGVSVKSEASQEAPTVKPKSTLETLISAFTKPSTQPVNRRNKRGSDE